MLAGSSAKRSKDNNWYCGHCLLAHPYMLAARGLLARGGIETCWAAVRDLTICPCVGILPMNNWGKFHSPPAKDVESEEMRFLVFILERKLKNNKKGKIKQQKKESWRKPFPLFLLSSSLTLSGWMETTWWMAQFFKYRKSNTASRRTKVGKTSSK